MPRAEPTGHSWITYGSTPRVAAAPGGAVQPYIAATDLFVGQDAEVASDFTVTPLGTVLGALPVGVVVGGRMTRYACCDQASDVGTQAARAGQSVLVANSGIAYKGTSPANAQKVVISLPLTPANTSAFISYPSLPGETGGVNVLYPYGDVRRYGAKLDGVTNDRAAFVAADASATLGIGGVSRVIQTTGTALIGSNLTLVNPFRPYPGAKVRPANAVIVTLNGDVHAGLYQWIDTSVGGKVTFAKGSVVSIHPHWWGPISSSATTLTAMFNALNTGNTTWNPRVRMPAGDYTINASVLGPNSLANVQFDGDGPRATRLLWTGGVAGPVVKWTNARGLKFRGIGVFNSGVQPTYGFQYDTVTAGKTATPMNCTHDECFFGGDSANAMLTGVGYTSSDSSDQNNEQHKFRACEFYNLQSAGVRFENSNALWTTFSDGCYFTNCGAAISSYVPGAQAGGGYTVTGCHFTICTRIFEVGASRYPITVLGCDAESCGYLINTPDPILAGSISAIHVVGGLWYCPNGVKWNSSNGSTCVLEDVLLNGPALLDFPGTDEVTIRRGSYNFAGTSTDIQYNGPTYFDGTKFRNSFQAISTRYSSTGILYLSTDSTTQLTVTTPTGTNVTLDVRGYARRALVHLNFGVATSVQSITNGFEGQEITFLADNGNATIAGTGGNIQLGVAASFAMSFGRTVTLVCSNGGVSWYEKGQA